MKIKKKFKILNCAGKSRKNSGTCYNERSLSKIKHQWNLRHTKKKINTNNPVKIWKELKKKLNNECDNEACWLKQKFMENNIDKELLHYTFAPNAPESWKKNKNEWLSSRDIEMVMKQFEYKFKNFAFIGPTPIDFDKKKIGNTCVWDDLCKFDLKSFLLKNKNKIGIIFNTDPHTKGGAHWICLMVDIKKELIYYFDSVGDKPQREILVLVKRIKDQGKKLNINFTYKHNHPFKHQKGNTECGIYTIYFLTEVLQNKKDYDFFTNSVIPDKEMEGYRSKFYN